MKLEMIHRWEIISWSVTKDQTNEYYQSFVLPGWKIEYFT